MSRTLFTLAFLWLGEAAFADVPKEDAGQVVDEVGDKLLRLRLETYPEKRIALMKEVGPIRDPRVTVALMDVVLNDQSEPDQLLVASSLLVNYHIPKEDWVPAKNWTVARHWWEKNGAEVRRRAEALPK